MSERINQLALDVLRTDVFDSLPDHIKKLFSKILTDTGEVPNIIIGLPLEQGANVAYPLISVYSKGAAEGLVGVYRHVDLYLDFWVSGLQAVNVEGRTVVAILYEYTRRQFQDKNWSKNGVLIKRSYETSRSEVLFEPDQKIYHITSTFRVEALSQTWY